MSGTATKNGTATKAQAISAASAKSTAAPSDKQVVIPRPQIDVITIRVEGITSLIVHSWSEKAIREMLSKQMKLAKLPKDSKNPEEDFIAARYITEEGWDGVVCGAFKSALVDASRQVDGLTMTLAKRLFFVEADGRCIKPVAVDGQIYKQAHDLVRIYGEPTMRMDMARNDNGSADIRFRPEYFPWRANLRIRFNASMISASQVANLVALAGMSEGIGEQRPSAPKNHGGGNGRWRIVE